MHITRAFSSSNPSWRLLVYPQAASKLQRSRSSVHALLSRFSTMGPSSTQTTPAIPRPSASLVIVNAHNEVLLVQRNPKARAFAGVHVFPGGNLDKNQDQSLEMTAIRETFEESGILLASTAAGASAASQLTESEMEEARYAIHQQKMLFDSFLKSNHLKADVHSLLRFTEWITPANAPRRFHTQFYVIFLPPVPSGFSSGAKQEQIPKPDGGQEVITARFVRPRDALEEFRQGKITFMPPQFYILSTLDQILEGDMNTAAQRESVRALSLSMFGRMVINPQRLQAEDSEGRTILTYEGDMTRGGPEGRLHRALVKVGKDGITSEIILQRNFNIFTEITPVNLSSKL